MPSERPSVAPERRRQQNRNIVRSWAILLGGLLLGTILILVKL